MTRNMTPASSRVHEVSTDSTCDLAVRPDPLRELFRRQRERAILRSNIIARARTIADRLDELTTIEPWSALWTHAGCPASWLHRVHAHRRRLDVAIAKGAPGKALSDAESVARRPWAVRALDVVAHALEIMRRGESVAVDLQVHVTHALVNAQRWCAEDLGREWIRTDRASDTFHPAFAPSEDMYARRHLRIGRELRAAAGEIKGADSTRNTVAAREIVARLLAVSSTTLKAWPRTTEAAPYDGRDPAARLSLWDPSTCERHALMNARDALEQIDEWLAAYDRGEEPGMLWGRDAATRRALLLDAREEVARELAEATPGRRGWS
jgi:hypothetical protein